MTYTVHCSPGNQVEELAQLWHNDVSPAHSAAILYEYFLNPSYFSSPKIYLAKQRIYVGPCYSSGRHRWSSGLLAPVPATFWDELANGKISLFFLFPLSFPFYDSAFKYIHIYTHTVFFF